MKGYVQIYTGNGKGKTTAGIGLAVRAAGAGLKVFIGQFIKMGDYSEIKIIKERFSDLITLEQFGTGSFIHQKVTAEHISAADRGFKRIREVLASCDYDVIICDEINVAVSLGLLNVGDVLEMISSKPESIELVFTGRGADPRMIEAADLVTEMTEIKHYYKAGVHSRTGIEK